MIIDNIPTLKVQKLTQEQYDTALQNGVLDNNSIYLTPTEIKDYALRSDLENKADLIDGKILTEQLPEATNEKLGVVKLDSTPIADSSNPITSGGVKTALDGIIQIAEGKCATYVFDYYDTLYDTLVGENQDTDFLSRLNAGDIFLIRDLKVPDYWWEPQTNAMILAEQEYNDIVVDGYGAARVLETTKCDLTDYALISDIPTKLPANGGNADTVDNYHIRTASEGDKGLAGYITFVI